MNDYDTNGGCSCFRCRLPLHQPNDARALDCRIHLPNVEERHRSRSLLARCQSTSGLQLVFALDIRLSRPLPTFSTYVWQLYRAQNSRRKLLYYTRVSAPASRSCQVRVPERFHIRGQVIPQIVGKRSTCMTRRCQVHTPGCGGKRPVKWTSPLYGC